MSNLSENLLSICVLWTLCAAGIAATPEYRIEAIRYGSFTELPTSTFIATADAGETIDAAAVVWLIRGGDRTILFDSGFHRTKWLETYPIGDFIRPDRVLEEIGVSPESVTDVIISHAHWDHMGGIDLFPAAQIWIQKAEYDYYTRDAWQPGGDPGPVDAEDVLALVRLNTQGRVTLIDGDGQEILPGITAFTGARHTYASQYLAIEGSPRYVLASDNCYLYRNLVEHEPVAILFQAADTAANLAAQSRMVELAGSMDRVVPGHDPEQFEVFPTQGRVARIK